MRLPHGHTAPRWQSQASFLSHVEKKVLEALTELLGQLQKGRRLLLQRKEVRPDREGACWGSPPLRCPPPPRNSDSQTRIQLAAWASRPSSL